MISLLLSLFLSTAEAKQIHIGIIDSGIPRFSTNLKVCPNGLYDLTHTDIYDKIEHGSNINGIISDKLKNIDYCSYVIKIYDNGSEGTLTLTLRALMLLYHLDVDIVNYSSTGSESSEFERMLIEGLINIKHVKFVTAAGNEHRDLDKKCGNFPACYRGVISVGNLNSDGSIASTSNYGKRITVWKHGMWIRANGITMSGTSQATAQETGDLALEIVDLYKHSK